MNPDARARMKGTGRSDFSRGQLSPNGVRIMRSISQKQLPLIGFPTRTANRYLALAKNRFLLDGNR